MDWLRRKKKTRTKPIEVKDARERLDKAVEAGKEAKKRLADTNDELEHLFEDLLKGVAQ